MRIGGTENRFSVPPPTPSIPDGTTPRERFAALLTELREVTAAVADAQFWTPWSTARAELTDVVARAVHALGYRGAKPKKNDPPLTVEALKALIEEKGGIPGMTQEIAVAVEQARESMVVKWGPVELKADQRRKRLCDQLDALADEVEVRPGPEPLVVRRHSSNYSQGPGGNESYARKRCEIDVTGWEPKGVQCDVVKDSHGYAARAWVEGELDVEVLRRAGPTIREFVRLAWKLGANPRVYIPTLPHGFEEREGLDRFGADLRLTPGGQSLADKDAEETRLLRACKLVVDANRVSQVKPGSWSVYTRPEGPPWGTALLLPGLVAFDWRGSDGSARTKAVYDVGEPVAGPLRVDGEIAEWDHDSKAVQARREAP